jgi:flagellar basal-body rod protein FlgB
MLNGVGSNLEQYMSLLSVRQRTVASNVANADTPGYKTKDIDFQSELSSAIAGGPPHLVEVQGLEMKHDGNNVSLDREARLLSENALRFNLSSNLLRGQLHQIRMAIEEGKNS